MPDDDKKGEIIEAGLHPDALDCLLQFADPFSYGDAFLLADWTVLDEVAELVALAKQDDDLRVKMAAMERLHKNAIEALTQGGVLRQVSMQGHDAEGNRLTVQQVANAANGARRRLSSHQDRLKEFSDADERDCIHKPPIEDLGRREAETEAREEDDVIDVTPELDIGQAPSPEAVVVRVEPSRRPLRPAPVPSDPEHSGGNVPRDPGDPPEPEGPQAGGHPPETDEGGEHVPDEEAPSGCNPSGASFLTECPEGSHKPGASR